MYLLPFSKKLFFQFKKQFFFSFEVKGFAQYVDLYLPEGSKKIYEKVNERWEVCAASQESGKFCQVSHVNSIWTMKGGTHCNYVADQLCEQVIKKVKSRTKVSLAIIFVTRGGGGSHNRTKHYFSEKTFTRIPTQRFSLYCFGKRRRDKRIKDFFTLVILQKPKKFWSGHFNNYAAWLKFKCNCLVVQNPPPPLLICIRKQFAATIFLVLKEILGKFL